MGCAGHSNKDGDEPGYRGEPAAYSYQVGRFAQPRDEKKADNAIEKLKFYEDSYHSCTLFSVDYYGYSSLESVLDYYKNYNIVCMKERKSYFSDNAILWIDKKLCSINNLRTQ